MAQIYKQWASVCTQFLDKAAVGETHASAHLLVGDMHEFKGFHYIVAEMPVEFLLYLKDFLIGFFREGVDEVFMYYLSTVSHDMIYDGIDEVADQI